MTDKKKKFELMETIMFSNRIDTDFDKIIIINEQIHCNKKSVQNY